MSIIGSTCCGVSVPVPLLCGLVLCALVKPLPGRRTNHIRYHQKMRKPASHLPTAFPHRRASCIFLSRVCPSIFVKSDIHTDLRKAFSYLACPLDEEIHTGQTSLVGYCPAWYTVSASVSKNFLCRKPTHLL